MDFPKAKERPLFLGQLNKMNTRIGSHKAIVNPDNNHVYSVLTNKYEITQHEEIMEIVNNAIANNTDYGDPVEKVQLYENGAKMRASLIFEDVEVTIDKGDKIHPQIEIFNSYDGGWARKIMFGAFRVVCSNGLVIGEKAFEFKQKHIQIFDEIAVGKAINASMEKFSEQHKVWEQWVDRVTTPEEYEKVITDLNLSKKDQDAIAQEVEISSNITMDDLRTKTLSKWMFFNILCQYFTHSVKSHLRRAQIENAMRRTF